MLFHTHVFLILFLPVVVVTYYILNKRRLVVLGHVWLTLASLFFYGWWDVRYLPLLLGSIAFNFIIAQFLDPDSGKKDKTRKRLLQFGIAANILLLCYFKYVDFFIQNANYVAGSNIPLINVALPLAISFFTLQQIAFLVDVYEDLTKEKRFFKYLLFVSFFPQLIAGPIVHHRNMISQFDSLKNRFLNHRNISMGLFILSMGLFKKVMVADQLEIYSSALYEDPENLSVFGAWLAAYIFTFQLYFDFSGYSDMAIGLGLLFNIMLPLNFNSPLKANNIVEFWRRWHITLADFIRTYVFSAMLRARKKVTYEYSLWALFVAMMLLGIWHGASWNFFFFGLLHALAVIIHSLWQKTKIKLPTLFSWFLTFNLIAVSLVFASVPDFESAQTALAKMFFLMPANGIDTATILTTFGIGTPCMTQTVLMPCEQTRLFNLTFLFGAIVTVFAAKNAYEWMLAHKPNAFYLCFNLVLLITPIIFISEIKEFIYFQF